MKKILFFIAFFCFASIVSAQNQHSINDFKEILNPDFGIDMSKYPAGMHPSKAFEIQSFEKMTVPQKVEWLREAIKSEKTNLQYDQTDPTVTKEEVQEQEKEIQNLEKLLKEFERKLKDSEPTV